MSISPFSLTGTYMKKLMLATMSSFPMPCLPSSAMKLSRQLGW